MKMREVLLEGLVAQVHLGKRADSGFKKEAWTTVLSAVQKAYYGTALKIKLQQVKSKYDWFKKS
jgi:hypothetical protein